MRDRSIVALLALGLAASASPGCAHDRGRITPTTSGTDLKAMPRGRMIPQPFPGSSLARRAPGSPRIDPAASVASGEDVVRRSGEIRR